MKKKLYFWPHGLTLFIVAFVLGMVIFFFYMQGQRTDLVTREYYKEQIAYQKRIEQIRRGQEIDSLLRRTLKPLEKQLVIEFDPVLFSQPLSGSIYLYRPSGSGYDRHWPLSIDASGRQVIDLKPLAPGLWRLKISLSQNGNDYYLEDRIDLP